MILIDVTDGTHLEWQKESPCDGFNLYRGDLQLLRSSGIYTQDPTGPLATQDCDRFVEKTIDSSSLPVGAAVFYLVACTQGGSEMGLGEDGSGLSRFNDGCGGNLPGQLRRRRDHLHPQRTGLPRHSLNGGQANWGGMRLLTGLHLPRPCRPGGPPRRHGELHDG